MGKKQSKDFVKSFKNCKFASDKMSLREAGHRNRQIKYMSKIEDVKIIELPKFLDARGNLCFIEQLNHIPFEIQRTYWIYDVPGGEVRGGHAFKQNQEFIVALSGSFDVIVDDGNAKKKFTLSRSYYGLYVPAGLWREIENFSTNSLALEFGSMHYDVNDYVRDYQEYIKLKKNEKI
jgi:dTDP-4-dehydrorhamnose 3,5-epimerase-like enzyme